MRKKLMLALIVILILSNFPFVYAKELYPPNIETSVSQSVYVQDETIEYENTESSVQSSGVFTEDKISEIDQLYSPVMKQLASYYYSYLNSLLDEEQLIEMLSWSDDDVATILNTFSESDKALLREHTPLVLNEAPMVEVQYDQQEQTVTDNVYGSVTNDVYGRDWSIQSENRFIYNEALNDMNYKVDLSNIVDPIFKTSVQRDVDLYLPGKGGLDLMIVRSYNSIQSNVFNPTLEYHEDGNFNSHFGKLSKYTLATGWTINIPYYEKNAYDICFSLEQGENYCFRDQGPITKYNMPYDNVSLRVGAYGSPNHYVLTVDELYAYSFNGSGEVTSKKNLITNDEIVYTYMELKISIRDTLNRTIELDRARNRYQQIAYFTQLVAKDADGNLLSHIRYNVEEKREIVERRRYLYKHNDLASDIWQLNSVTDVLANRTLKTYTYYDSHPTRKADLDFRGLYNDTDFRKNSPGSSGSLDIQVNGQPTEDSFMVSSHTNHFAETYYKLLKEVTDDSGFSVQYFYEPYNENWYTEIRNGLLTHYTEYEQNRGTIRKYVDNIMNAYIGYHPLTSVFYKYTDHEGQTRVLEQQVLRDRNKAQEIWMRPKAGDKHGNIRLANAGSYRQGDIIDTTFVWNMGEFTQQEKYKYRVIQDNHKVLIYESSYQGTGPNGINNTDGSYRNVQAPWLSTTYQYDANKIHPYLTKTFDEGGSGDPRSTSIKNFLINGNSRSLPSNLGQYATLQKKEYNNLGYVTYEEDAMGNKTEYQYNGPRNQISNRKTTSADQLTTFEERYTYRSDDLLNTLVQISTYRNPQNASQVFTDTVETSYLEYYAAKVPKKIRIKTSGNQYAPTETITEFEYDSRWFHVTKETVLASLGHGRTAESLVLQYQYDNKDRLTRQTFPDLSQATYTYDFKDRITSATFIPSSSNPGAQRTTTYAYNDATRKVTITAPDGLKTITTYTPYGEIGRVEEQSGSTTRTTLINRMNSRGNLIVASDPYGDTSQRISIAYGGNGQFRTQTNALGQQMQYHYANASYHTNGSSAYVQDAVRITEPDSRELWTYVDRAGRVTKELEKSATDTRTSTFTYTPLGKVAQKQVTAKGRTQTTKYKYDAVGNLIYLEDDLGQNYRYVYNHNGQVLAIYMNGQLEKSQQYNEVGWMLSKTNSGGQRENYHYTKNGLLERHIDKAGQTHHNTYTPYYELSRSRVTAANGSELHWTQNTYHANSRKLTQISNSEGQTLAYGYDLWNRLASQTVAGRQYTLGYDGKDRLSSLRYPDGKTTAYTYDVLNRLKTVSDPDMGTVTYNYTTSNNENKYERVYPNNQRQELKTNAFKERVSETHRNGSTTNWLETFGYDGFGNITGINRNGANLSFSYDGLNRIAQENVSEGTTKYAYDVKGNRMTMESTQFPGFPSGEQTYTYNALNQLKTYSAGAGNTASYTYYGDGLRATKSVDGVLTRFVYLNGRVIEELDANGNRKARNVWGNELIFRHDQGTNQSGYYYYNGHGDVIAVKNAQGNPLNSYEYDIWGKVKQKTETMPNPFRYTGEIQDDESGLIYLRSRYYDPSMGRFISQDTYEGELNNPLTLNLYTYVENNPLKYIDPTGHSAEIPYMIDMARQAGSSSQSYWDIRSQLGSANLRFSEDNNNQFKYLFGLATLTSDYKEQNTLGNAEWAKQELIKMFDLNQQSWESDVGTATMIINMFTGNKGSGGKAQLNNTGRGKNTMKYDSTATGEHSTYKRDSQTGEITNWQTWKTTTDSRNPHPFVPSIRFDGKGKGHVNKVTGQKIETPHVNDPSAPGGVRVPHPWEFPGKP